VAPPAPTDSPATTQRIPVWSSAEAGDAPGSSFGQYTLLEKIAVGGMAEVWKARSRGVEGFQKTVAIKKILPHMTDNVDFVGMFIDEAKLAAQLNHPNIVHIYDLGKIGRDYYIAMEYVEGKDLRSLLNAAQDHKLRMPPGLAALIAARLANALDYAHRKRDFDAKAMGLVHRDVSPQNVLLTFEGDVKLCDFGIAKAVAKVGQTQTGALKGKLQYMSPEQAWGRAVDARSDLFSLGSVLFEMLTAERLFPGDTEISILDSVRQGKVRHPRQVDPTVPQELDEIVRKALAVDPDHRFQSAGEMLHQLEGYLARLSPSVGPTDVASFLERALSPVPPAALAPEAFLFESPAPTAAGGALPLSSAWSPPTPAEPSAAPDLGSTPGDHFEPNVAAVVPLTEVAPALRDGEKKGKLLLWIGIAALVVVGVLLYFYLSTRGAKPPAASPSPAAVEANGAPALPATSDATGAALTSDGTTEGAPGVNIEGMVNQALAKREQELRQLQEESIKRLQQQVTASKVDGKVPPGAAAVAESPPPYTRPAPIETAPPPAPAQVEAPPVEKTEPKPEPPPRQAEPAPEQPEGPRVKQGDLVSGGPGVAPPQLVSAPNPEYPAMARNLKVQGVVVISVLVNENGQVEDAKIAEPIRQNVGLNEAALRAARGARYRSATKDGVRVKMWTRIRIPFKL
jgi:TonB family protein